MTLPKSLPERPSQESLRKQAKKLARDIAAGDAHCIFPCPYAVTERRNAAVPA